MDRIAIIGTGRMAKGMALAFGWAGRNVTLVDSEERPAAAFEGLHDVTQAELEQELGFLREAGAIPAGAVDAIANAIRVVDRAAGPAAIGAADFVFEAVVEVRDIKQQVYAWLGPHLAPGTVVSSTTSTMSANDLAAFVDRPERFVNGHWLNPAHLMPLVEVSPADGTSTATVARFRSLLEDIGKVPVVCRASPGFIVPRIQALAMNEAARLVEEGVASAEDVDTAVKVGFGIRFATLGLLEFIDWGGGDILYHATQYLAQHLDADRFRIPEIVRSNMEGRRNGLRDGAGFYEWHDRDVEAYRKARLTEFVQLLRHRDLLPRPDASAKGESPGEAGE